jgi:hypothetical protein
MCILKTIFLLHARNLEHVHPLSVGSGVTVFQVLPEVIGAMEFFGLVVLAKSVILTQMLCASVPVCRDRKFVATVTTNIGHCGMDVGRMESGLHSC